MNELIPTINEIAKFGLEPSVIVDDKFKSLEENLIKVYNLYFQIKFTFDETDYKDFEIPSVKINESIINNFPEFGFYKTVLDILEIDNKKDVALGYAVDDLSDIIIDLLEVKWRLENNSIDDGMWFFEFIFITHTKQHILDLLQYLKQIN
jgi:hypothetical protein